MGHTHDYVADASFCCLHQKGVQQWNDNLATFQ